MFQSSTSSLQTHDDDNNDCELLHSANYATALPPPLRPALLPARQTPSRRNTYMCVYIYVHMYTCINVRRFACSCCLHLGHLPPPTASGLQSHDDNKTRLTANFYTSAILRPFIILQRRDDDTRIYNFCTPPITCPPSPPPPPPSLRPLPSCLVSNFVKIQRNLFLRLLSTRNTNFCFGVVSLILFQRRDDDTGICNVCTRQLRGRPPPPPPPRFVLSCYALYQIMYESSETCLCVCCLHETYAFSRYLA